MPEINGTQKRDPESARIKLHEDLVI